MAAKYTRPILSGHKVLYKGLRFWIFEISKDFPFNGIEEYANLVVYDCLKDYVMIDGVQDPDGSVTGFIQIGQGGIDIGGRDARQFLDHAVAQWKQLDDQF